MKIGLTFLARFISLIFHPAVLQGIFLLAPWWNTLTLYRFFPSLLLGAVVFPLAISGIYLQQIGIKNWFVVSRENRLIPFLITITCLILLAGFWWQDIPALSGRIIWVVFINISAVLITLKEKISLHILGLISATGMLMELNPLFGGIGLILLIPIAFSRYYLKSHSIKQLIYGGIIGLIWVTLYYLFRDFLPFIHKPYFYPTI